MRRSIPRARAVTFEDAGHAVMLEEPARFGQLVKEFAWSL
jgi:pimeloyl-ACP methyl ester carboxylesterase